MKRLLMSLVLLALPFMAHAQQKSMLLIVDAACVTEACTKGFQWCEQSGSATLYHCDTTTGFYVEFGSGAGAGDVVGPGSATNDSIARYDTTTGKLLQDSGLLVTITDAGDIFQRIGANTSSRHVWATSGSGQSPYDNFRASNGLGFFLQASGSGDFWITDQTSPFEGFQFLNATGATTTEDSHIWNVWGGFAAGGDCDDCTGANNPAPWCASLDTCDALYDGRGVIFDGKTQTAVASTELWKVPDGDLRMTFEDTVTANMNATGWAFPVAGFLLDGVVVSTHDHSGGTAGVTVPLATTATTATNVATDGVGDIADIAAGVKSGLDVTLVTGTKGTTGTCAEWDANGDLIEAASAAACGAGGGEANTLASPDLGAEVDLINSVPKTTTALNLVSLEADDFTSTANIITVDSTMTRDTEWDTLAEINAASTDTDAVLDTDIGGTVQAWDAELDTIAALAETNGGVMFVAGGVWTTDLTPAIDCTDCTNIPAGSTHTGTVTWSSTPVLESGAAFTFGDGTDATITHTVNVSTGTDPAIAYTNNSVDFSTPISATSFTADPSDTGEMRLTTVTGSDQVAIGITQVTGDSQMDFTVDDGTGDDQLYFLLDGIGETVDIYQPIDVTHGTSPGEISLLEGSGWCRA